LSNFRYANIKYNDIVDGEKVCVSFWTQGCPHRCHGCHNPETWAFDGGQEFTEEILDNMLDKIRENGIDRNFSILGGEPLCINNLDLTKLLLKRVRERYPNITIYVWTGYTLRELIGDEIYDDVLPMIDVLIDGRYIEKERNLKLHLRGSNNQRIWRKKDNNWELDIDS